MDININSSAQERFDKISYITILIMSIASVYYLYKGNIPFAITESIFVLLFAINLFLNHSIVHKVYILIILGAVLFTLLLYTGGILNTGWLWSLTFAPIINILLLEKSVAIMIKSYAATLLSILFLQLIFDIQTAYSGQELLILFLVYTFNAYLISTFQSKIGEYNIELTKVNKELNHRIEEAIKANERKNKILNTQAKQAQMGEMVSMIAHQWRQPLNAISASAIKLKLENDLGVMSETSIDSASIFIQDRTQDMSEIINNFLDYSKPTNKHIHFSTTELINKTCKVINTQFSLRGIFLTLDFAQYSKDSKMLGVENLLEQVILNLLLNVRDAFDEKTNIAIKNIKISVDKDSNITIEDNAGGISSDLHDKVFNPYFTTKEEGKGTGLGLYMSRKIMRDNFNGDLLYKPLADGSCFTILFNINSDESLEDET